MRRALPVLLALAAAPALAGPGGAPPAREPPPRITSVADMERRIADSTARLERLLEKARQDPRMAKVERYLSWSSAQDFQNPRRDVHVSDLLEMVADEEAPKELREKARDALKSPTHKSFDPDVDIASSHSKRAAFSMARVVPLLGSRPQKPGTSGDMTRAFAAEILDSYWHYTHKAIQLYDPKDPLTWKPAQEEWRKFLSAR